MINFNSMTITTYMDFKISDLLYKEAYSKVYLLKKDLASFKFIDKNKFEELTSVLLLFIDKEAKALFENELLKTLDYISFNENSQSVIYEEELFLYEFKHGVMNKLTAQSIIDYDVQNRGDIKEFRVILSNLIKEDIFITYEEIERNLDGRWGVKYEL